MADRSVSGPDCPFCGGRIPWPRVMYTEVFSCPSCATGLQVPDFYKRRQQVLTFVIVTVVGYAAGARGVMLIIIILAAFAPVSGIVWYTTRTFMPPPLMVNETVDHSSPDERAQRNDG